MEKFQNKYRISSARLQQWDYRWAGAYFITICTQNREHYFGDISNGKMQLSHVGIIADILWHQIPYHSKNVELGAFVVMPNHIHGILIKTQNDIDNGDANAVVDGDAMAYGDTVVDGDAMAYGDTMVDGDAMTYGDTVVDGDTVAYGDTVIVETGHALSLQRQQQPIQPQQQPIQQPIQQRIPQRTSEQTSQRIPERIPQPPKTIGQQRFQNIGKNSISAIIGSYKSAVTKYANRLKFEFQWQTRFYDHIIRDDKSFQTILNYIINNPANWQDDKFFK
jgi:REP element-mobilizing transposase RayT